ncbi:MAG: methyltransferase domain-containing protein [Candidatus Brocadiales bacterium]
MDWVNNLVCPITRTPLHLEAEELVCEDGEHRYSFKDGIATFLGLEERRKWDDYHLNIYPEDPQPPHPYYTRFTGGWKTMLDVGSGDGIMSAGSANNVREIYCLNPGYTALQVLRKRGVPNMYPVNASGERMPFRDNFFDGVFNIFVIEHIRDPGPMLQEIRRVLKTEGRLVISTDTAYYYKYLRPILEWRRMGWSRGWRKWKPNDPTHVNMMTPSHLRSWLSSTGFEIVEEDINFIGGKFRRFFGWMPHSIWEACLSYGFTFVCRKGSL